MFLLLMGNVCIRSSIISTKISRSWMKKADGRMMRLDGRKCIHGRMEVLLPTSDNTCIFAWRFPYLCMEVLVSLHGDSCISDNTCIFGTLFKIEYMNVRFLWPKFWRKFASALRCLLFCITATDNSLASTVKIVWPSVFYCVFIHVLTLKHYILTFYIGYVNTGNVLVRYPNTHIRCDLCKSGNLAGIHVLDEYLEVTHIHYLFSLDKKNLWKFGNQTTQDPW